MGILLVRDSAAASSGPSGHDIAKNVGIVLGCLAVLAIMLPIIARSCNLCGWGRNADTPEPASQTTSARRYLNAAEIMRLCAIRDSNRPPPPVKPVKKSLLTSAEVELAAPKISYARLVAREKRKSKVTVPPKALVREDGGPRTSTEAADYSGREEKADLTTVLTFEHEEQEPVCSICLEGYEDDDAVRETVCHHLFHSCCLEQWLMKRRSHCPLCQGDLKLKREDV